ncbi:MAG: alpha-amylase [Lachnospiraceae bacterium]|nr:alpha-amylase [Lachnospiraceae bacterium]
MHWYKESVFYHIYPLGLTGAAKINEYKDTEHRLMNLLPWILHLKDLGVTGLYIGPIFESGSHGYDTTDYRMVDRRLGTNEDLKNFVKECHAAGIRVILDAVFNHTGRDFFAFRDLRENREQSAYRDWYCNVNFWNNNEYNDGFSYDNWGGHNMLAKLNVWNPEVREYLFDTVRFWVNEFDIDGLRLDAADVLDFGFMRDLRGVANAVKPDFWLMGEVIHGEYQRWLNPEMLHSVTDYAMHKALWSGHNDHNYFEIAHTLNRSMQNGIDPRALYRFVDNHDVERIYNKLDNKANFEPVHILLFALPGIPSLYYGSEFAIEGKKEKGSDDSLRPCLNLCELLQQRREPYELIKKLAGLYHKENDLAAGDYEQLILTTRQYAFRRGHLIIAVNNDEQENEMWIRCGDGIYRGALHGHEYTSENGGMSVKIPANSGEIFCPM